MRKKEIIIQEKLKEALHLDQVTKYIIFFQLNKIVQKLKLCHGNKMEFG